VEKTKRARPGKDELSKPESQAENEGQVLLNHLSCGSLSTGNVGQQRENFAFAPAVHIRKGRHAIERPRRQTPRTRSS